MLIAIDVGNTQTVMGLFDGTDLSEWRSADGGAARWVIDDGAIEVTGRLMQSASSSYGLAFGPAGEPVVFLVTSDGRFILAVREATGCPG